MKHLTEPQNTSTQSDQTKLKTQEVEGMETSGQTKNKILLYIIIIGAVLGSIAPFVHIILPANPPELIELRKEYKNKEISKKEYNIKKDVLKEKYQVYGFSTMRAFLFAIGFPIALFICSLFILYLSYHISDDHIKKGAEIFSIATLITGLFFLLWTRFGYGFDEKDFSEEIYYFIMVVISLIITFSIFKISRTANKNKHKIRELISFIIHSRTKFFSLLEKHESQEVIRTEKEDFDDSMYETFEKIID